MALFKRKRKSSSTNVGRCTYGNKRGRCIKPAKPFHRTHYGANGDILINAERNGY